MLDRSRSSGTDDGTPCRSTKEADLTAGRSHDRVSVLYRLCETAREPTEWQRARENCGQRQTKSATDLHASRLDGQYVLIIVMTSETAGSKYIFHQ